MRISHLDGLPNSFVIDAQGIAHHPDLGVSEVKFEEQTIGYLLGDPIGLERLRNCSWSIGDLDDIIEENIYALSGSFLFVLDWNGVKRVYLDANGTLPVVYDPVATVAASRTELLLSETEYRARFRSDLFNALRVSESGWFPAGLTAHEGVSRLTTNHYLDLSSMVPVRHWPKKEVSLSEDPAITCQEIAQDLTRTVKNLAGPVNVALTAGNETRMLLACCLGLDVTYVTVGSRNAVKDRHIASILADKFRVRHKFLPVRYATDDERRVWRRHVSDSVGGPKVATYPTMSLLAGEWFVGGLGGEVARAFLWRDDDSPETKLDAKGIVARLGLPPAPDVVRAVEDWLRPLGEFDSLFLLDLAYIELRMGSWAFAQTKPINGYRELNPLVSRSMYERMLSLPPHFKRSNLMSRTIVSSVDDRLLDVPINSYGDVRDVILKIRQVIRHPYSVIRHVRKRIG